MLALMGTIAGTPLCQASQDKDTAIKFVNEYIRELDTFDGIRADFGKERKNTSGIQQVLAGIAASEKFQLELQLSIENLKGYNFPAPLDSLVANLTELYRMKIDLSRQMSDASSRFLGGPTPDVDYGKLLADLSKKRAQIQYIDKSLLQCSPLVVMTLVDLTQEDESKPVRLTITRAERGKLLTTLRADFGPKLDQKGQTFEASAAGLVRDLLLRYKCADDVN